MKLNDIPEPVWYALLGLAAFGGVWWLGKRAAGAVGDAARAAGGAVDDALAPDLIFGEGASASGTIRRRYTDPDGSINWTGLAVDGYRLNPITAGLGAVGSWATAQRPPYDYGTGSTDGIPYRRARSSSRTSSILAWTTCNEPPERTVNLVRPGRDRYRPGHAAGPVAGSGRRPGLHLRRRRRAAAREASAVKFATAANTVTAALIALAAFQFNRVVTQLDTIAARVQQHEVSIALLQSRQP